MHKKAFSLLAAVFLIILIAAIWLNINKITEIVKENSTKKVVIDTNLNKSVKEFKDNKTEEFKRVMKSKYKVINSINVSCTNVNLTINYTLNKDISENERNKIFNETKLFLIKEDFESSIQKEANRKNFFTHITIILKNPESKYNILYQTVNFQQTEVSNCNWNIYDFGKVNK